MIGLKPVGKARRGVPRWWRATCFQGTERHRGRSLQPIAGFEDAFEFLEGGFARRPTEAVCDPHGEPHESVYSRHRHFHLLGHAGLRAAILQFVSDDCRMRRPLGVGNRDFNSIFRPAARSRISHRVGVTSSPMWKSMW